MMNYGCKGLNVVISGGTSGIGLATAEKFLADGANVFILGRSFLRGTMAVQKLQVLTESKVFYVPCDVTNKEDCQKALAARNDKKKYYKIRMFSSMVFGIQHMGIA